MNKVVVPTVERVESVAVKTAGAWWDKRALPVICIVPMRHERIQKLTPQSGYYMDRNTLRRDSAS